MASRVPIWLSPPPQNLPARLWAQVSALLRLQQRPVFGLLGELAEAPAARGSVTCWTGRTSETTELSHTPSAWRRRGQCLSVLFPGTQALKSRCGKPKPP